MTAFATNFRSLIHSQIVKYIMKSDNVCLVVLIINWLSIYHIYFFVFSGESIPVRLFLSPYDPTPTYRNTNNKFSVKYYLNLVLVDEEDRRYFKQQEITLYRLLETLWKFSCYVCYLCQTKKRNLTEMARIWWINLTRLI